MSKHSPGPWFVGEIDPTIIHNREMTIAVSNRKRGNRKEQKANCDLIAAAPDMLTVLKAIMKLNPDKITIRGTAIPLFQSIPELIKKAEGV